MVGASLNEIRPARHCIIHNSDNSTIMLAVDDVVDKRKG